MTLLSESLTSVTTLPFLNEQSLGSTVMGVSFSPPLLLNLKSSSEVESLGMSDATSRSNDRVPSVSQPSVIDSNSKFK